MRFWVERSSPRSGLSRRFRDHHLIRLSRAFRGRLWRYASARFRSGHEGLAVSDDELIRVERITKVFRSRGTEVRALENVSFAVSRREFVSVMGPSGCGKTTLLRILGGLLDADGGLVTVDGHDAKAARRKRYFGFVSQDPVLLPWRTVAQNVQLPGEIMHDGSVFRRADDCLELVGLDGFRDSLPNELSGGMKARVAIARALCYAPPILLMDEPFGDLDEITRHRLNRELLSLWNRTETTVVFVTHTVEEAVFLSDRVLLLTALPGRVANVIDVELPRPRKQEARRDPRFIDKVESIRECIEKAEGGPEAIETR